MGGDPVRYEADDTTLVVKQTGGFLYARDVQQTERNPPDACWTIGRRSSVRRGAVHHGRGQTLAAGTVPAFDHVFVIVMENHSYSDIIGNTSQPYLNLLASQHGLATNYFAVVHPTLPNYLALIGGSTFGITSDCTTCFVNQPNLPPIA